MQEPAGTGHVFRPDAAVLSLQQKLPAYPFKRLVQYCHDAPHATVFAQPGPGKAAVLLSDLHQKQVLLLGAVWDFLPIQWRHSVGHAVCNSPGAD